MLSGRVPPADFAGKRLYEVMDLCLECKGCKAECPSNVDMAKLKYEFLHHYHSANGLPLRNRLFGRIARLSRWGSRLAPLSNWIAASAPNRWLMERVAGIDRRRPLPRLRARDVHRLVPAPRAARGRAARARRAVPRHVRDLQHAGRRAGRGGAPGGGRLSRGARRQDLLRPAPHLQGDARRGARARRAQRRAPVGAGGPGAPVVGLEPSCLLTLRDEYVDLLRTDEARAVAKSSFLLEDSSLRERARGLTLPWKPGSRRALLHGHCHQKAMVGTAPTVAALSWAGYEVAEVDSGCCGMAGSFGFEKEHYDVSITLGNRRLAPAVKAASAETDVVAPGISCRQQIEHLTSRRAIHPAEALRSQLAI